MTKPIFTAATLALSAAVFAASVAPASAGLFRNKERRSTNERPVIVDITPREARQAKREINQKPYILNNKVYPGMKFEPPNSAFFGGNPMIGPSSW